MPCGTFVIVSWSKCISLFRAGGTGGVGASPPPQIMTDQVTLFYLVGADYAHHINTPPGFLDLPPALGFFR